MVKIPTKVEYVTTPSGEKVRIEKSYVMIGGKLYPEKVFKRAGKTYQVVYGPEYKETIAIPEKPKEYAETVQGITETVKPIGPPELIKQAKITSELEKLGFYPTGVPRELLPGSGIYGIIQEGRFIITPKPEPITISGLGKIETRPMPEVIPEISFRGAAGYGVTYIPGEITQFERMEREVEMKKPPSQKQIETIFGIAAYDISPFVPLVKTFAPSTEYIKITPGERAVAGIETISRASLMAGLFIGAPTTALKYSILFPFYARYGAWELGVTLPKLIKEPTRPEYWLRTSISATILAGGMIPSLAKHGRLLEEVGVGRVEEPLGRFDVPRGRIETGLGRAFQYPQKLEKRIWGGLARRLGLEKKETEVEFTFEERGITKKGKKIIIEEGLERPSMVFREEKFEFPEVEIKGFGIRGTKKQLETFGYETTKEGMRITGGKLFVKTPSGGIAIVDVTRREEITKFLGSDVFKQLSSQQQFVIKGMMGAPGKIKYFEMYVPTLKPGEKPLDIFRKDLIEWLKKPAKGFYTPDEELKFFLTPKEERWMEPWIRETISGVFVKEISPIERVTLLDIKPEKLAPSFVREVVKLPPSPIIPIISMAPKELEYPDIKVEYPKGVEFPHGVIKEPPSPWDIKVKKIPEEEYEFRIRAPGEPGIPKIKAVELVPEMEIKIQKVKPIVSTQQTQKEMQRQLQITGQIQKEVTTQRQIQEELQIQKQLQRQLQITGQKPIQITRQIQKQVLRQFQVPSLQLKQLQRQVTKVGIPTVPTFPAFPPPPKPPEGFELPSFKLGLEIPRERIGKRARREMGPLADWLSMYETEIRKGGRAYHPRATPEIKRMFLKGLRFGGLRFPTAEMLRWEKPRKSKRKKS